MAPEVPKARLRAVGKGGGLFVCGAEPPAQQVLPKVGINEGVIRGGTSGADDIGSRVVVGAVSLLGILLSFASCY